MDKVLELENLTTLTPNREILSSNLNLTLRSGEILAIEGENGAGKTTLVRTILGLHKRFKGRVNLTISLDHVAYLPQLGNVQFFLPLTLRDVVRLKCQEASDESIGELGFLTSAHLDRPWNSASGGERQKTLLSRILLNPPRLAIFDEPFNHLDQLARGRLIEHIQALAHSQCAVILISHMGSQEWLLPHQHLLLKRVMGDS